MANICRVFWNIFTCIQMGKQRFRIMCGLIPEPSVALASRDTSFELYVNCQPIFKGMAVYKAACFIKKEYWVWKHQS